MGFSASQARHLALTARMSDIEFQGQQINQQRTTLSNSTNAEYSKLQDMVVPVPPSVQAFKKIEYSFMFGTTPTTLGTIRPDGGQFSIELLQQRVGNYLDETGNILVTREGGGYTVAYDGGTRELHSLDSVSGDGQPISPTELNDYVQAYRNTHPEDRETPDDRIIDRLSVYFKNVQEDGVTPQTGSPVVFIERSDLAVLQEVGSTSWIPQRECIPNGMYTDRETVDGCLLTFDPANGRILEIAIPSTGNDGTGVMRSYPLEASETTDDEAYQDAFNNYEYEKNLYDQKQEEINKKLKVLENEDKSLQLKLTRLDQERNAVNTELEAVKKVIQDNIDKSFKSFGG